MKSKIITKSLFIFLTFLWLLFPTVGKTESNLACSPPQGIYTLLNGGLLDKSLLKQEYPDLAGVSARFKWAEIEPVKGEY